MRKLVSLCTSLGATLLLISAGPVRAQNVLWVSANGNDANSCSQAAPCLTFQAAINKGNVAQINCLTSGNYGPFTVTTSIAIDCGTGNIGNVVVSGQNTNAVTVSTSSTATIVLRHLRLNGLGSATNGISAGAFSSGALIIDECVIQGFAGGDGIAFAPTGGRGTLQVSNSQILNNGNGVAVLPQNGQIATVTLNRVELSGHTSDGLVLSGAVVAGTMRDSLAAGNASRGILSNASQAFFTVEESSIVANLNAGIQTSSAGSVINVGASTIGGNGTGLRANAGSIISFGNNQMSANGSNGNFTSATPLQ
jgi:hypothetical protein